MAGLDDLELGGQIMIWAVLLFIIILVILVGFFADSIFVWMRGAATTKRGALGDIALQFLFFGAISFILMASFRSMSAKTKYKDTFHGIEIVLALILFALTQGNLIHNLRMVTKIGC